MTMPRYVVDGLGGQPGPGVGVETALAQARHMAERDGECIMVNRLPDGALIATVWPNGQIDLTYEGSKVA